MAQPNEPFISFDYSLTSRRSLPDEFYRLYNLKVLNLSNNALTSLSPLVEQLFNLTELLLGFNQLSSLPEQYLRAMR